MPSSNAHRARGLVVLDKRKSKKLNDLTRNIMSMVYSQTTGIIILTLIVLGFILSCTGKLADFIQKNDSVTTPIIKGKVFNKSDILLFPDPPAEGVLVIAFQEQVFRRLFKGENIRRFSPEDFPQVTEELANKKSASFDITGESGSYSLEVQPGSYLLCLGLAKTSPADIFPVQVGGCVKSTAESGEVTTRKIYFGGTLSGVR